MARWVQVYFHAWSTRVRLLPDRTWVLVDTPDEEMGDRLLSRLNFTYGKHSPLLDPTTEYILDPLRHWAEIVIAAVGAAYIEDEGDPVESEPGVIY